MLLKGIIFALISCLIWGLIFVIPQLMIGFSPVEVVFGRYFFYGLISLSLFIKKKTSGLCNYAPNIWRKALLFSFAASFGYYTWVVIALRCADPAVCALILGLSPITIGVYANIIKKEGGLKTLFFPSLFIIFGLVMINLPHFQETSHLSDHLLGILFCLIALASWTWYAVKNAHFLKEHVEVNPSDWASMIGIMTLPWSMLGLTIFLFTLDPMSYIAKYTLANSSFQIFLLGSLILGLFCSWIAGFLWNKASLYLPVSLAGQLMIFETIFGVLFVYILEKRLPSLLETLGIVILLLSISYSMKAFKKAPAH